MSQSHNKLSRRTLFGAAATTGAVAAVASLVPSQKVEPEALADQPKQPPARGGGYQLSEHVKQYYQTTRL
jgi:hypothetical protein